MDLLNKIKQEVAKDFGVTIELPTLWDYAMLLTSRTKKQIELYEEVIKRMMEELTSINKDSSFIVRDWMVSEIHEFHNYEDAKIKYDEILEDTKNDECDIQLYQIINEHNNIK